MNLLHRISTGRIMPIHRSNAATCQLSMITIIIDLDSDDPRQSVKENNCQRVDLDWIVTKVDYCDDRGETIGFELVKETEMVKLMKQDVQEVRVGEIRYKG